MVLRKRLITLEENVAVPKCKILIYRLALIEKRIQFYNNNLSRLIFVIFVFIN